MPKIAIFNIYQIHKKQIPKHKFSGAKRQGRKKTLVPRCGPEVLFGHGGHPLTPCGGLGGTHWEGHILRSDKIFRCFVPKIEEYLASGGVSTWPDPPFPGELRQDPPSSLGHET